MIKDNPLSGLLAAVWKYSKGNRGNVILFVALSVIANCIILAEPLVIGRVFDSVQFSYGDVGFLHSIVKNLSLLLAITVGFWAFHGTSRVIERRNAFLVRKRYKMEMLDQVLDLPAAWHKDHHSGNTIDKINKSADSLFNFSGNIYTIVQNLIRLTGALSILFFFDWKMSALAVAASLVAIISMLRFDKVLSSYYAKIFKAENYLAAAVHDYVSNILTIITLKFKPRVSREIRLRSDAGYGVYKKSLVISELKWFWVNFLVSLMIVGVLILYAYQSYRLSGVIVIGTLFTLYRYLQSVGDVFASFASRYGEYVQQEAALKAAAEISLDHKKTVQVPALSLPQDWRTLEVKDLSFFYEKREGQELKMYRLDLAGFAVSRGQKIALIGESGSGKSTTLALLRGLYRPRKMKLVCDGQELSGGLAHLYNSVTLIPQDPELFNSTIEDNITMDTRVSRETLQEIIGLSCLESVLNRLPQGLLTNVQEKGVSLSGGEKQRIALARGLLSAKSGNGEGGDFLFLDEPTSSVDATNELKIYENIFSAFRHKTIIATIHRLHLLRFFDYVYFFKDGEVIAQGTLEQLSIHPEFRSLWDNYSQTFQVTVNPVSLNGQEVRLPQEEKIAR